MNRSIPSIGLLLTLSVVGALLVVPGCSKKRPSMTDVTQETTPPSETQPQEPGETTEQPEGATEVVLTDVFFDYDRYNLREDARRVLEVDARMLLDNPGINVVLEGHCDERGTVEYNLALGERRAQSVKSYLVEFGIDPGRLTTVSYGEERPFAKGHDESAWAQNRRVHFLIR